MGLMLVLLSLKLSCNKAYSYHPDSFSIRFPNPLFGFWGVCFFILSLLTLFISESQTKHMGLASPPAWVCAPQSIATVVIDPFSKREGFFIFITVGKS